MDEELQEYETQDTEETPDVEATDGSADASAATVAALVRERLDMRAAAAAADDAELQKLVASLRATGEATIKAIREWAADNVPRLQYLASTLPEAAEPALWPAVLPLYRECRREAKRIALTPTRYVAQIQRGLDELAAAGEYEAGAARAHALARARRDIMGLADGGVESLEREYGILRERVKALTSRMEDLAARGVKVTRVEHRRPERTASLDDVGLQPFADSHQTGFQHRTHEERQQ